MPKIVDHSHRKTFILDSSLELFAAHGYASLSMRQLSKSMGFTTGVLYHYFPSKSEILAQLLRENREQDIAEAAEKIGQSKDLLGRLEALCIFIDNNSDRLSRLLLVGIEALKIESTDGEFPPIQNTISAYRQALLLHLKLPLPDMADLLLNYLLGHLLRHVLEGGISMQEQFGNLVTLLRLR